MDSGEHAPPTYTRAAQIWDETRLLRGAPVSYQYDPWLRRGSPSIPPEKLEEMRARAKPFPANATDEYAQTPGFSVRALAAEAKELAQGALLLRVCDKRYSATQFALLSSLFGLGRWAAGLPSGFLVQRLGYPAFFALACVLALPGFFFLQRIAPFRQREVTAAPTPATGP